MELGLSHPKATLHPMTALAEALQFAQYCQDDEVPMWYFGNSEIELTY